MTPCRAVKMNGEPCKAVQSLVDGLCQAHDPARAAEAQARRVRGGKAAHGRPNLPTEPMPPLETLEDCDVVAGWITAQVIKGALDPKVAQVAINGIAQKRHVLKSIHGTEEKLKALAKAIAREEARRDK